MQYFALENVANTFFKRYRVVIEEGAGGALNEFHSNHPVALAVKPVGSVCGDDVWQISSEVLCYQ